MDGDSGILDVAREIKQRVKAFAYVYRLTNDTKWVDRAWSEVQVCWILVCLFGLCPDAALRIERGWEWYQSVRPV